jgi:hypothetical protein
MNQKQLEKKLKFRKFVEILVNQSKIEKNAKIKPSIIIGKINDFVSSKSGIN